MVLAEPQIPAADPAASKKSRRLRIYELILVVSVGFLISTVSSFRIWWAGEYAPETVIDTLYRILDGALAISVLVYVLYRQGRSLRSIGFTVRVSDFFWGLTVWFFSYLMAVATASAVVTLPLSFPEAPGQGYVGWLLWLSIVPGAAAEELVVRAYLMTEVAALTGHMWIAVLASVGFQTLYHLYHGTPYALVNAGGFFVSAVFYANTRRVTPVILAHAWHNFWVFL
jgi:membrane protease YdiL (CAAX protease family)